MSNWEEKSKNDYDNLVDYFFKKITHNFHAIQAEYVLHKNNLIEIFTNDADRHTAEEQLHKETLRHNHVISLSSIKPKYPDGLSKEGEIAFKEALQMVKQSLEFFDDYPD